MSENGLITIKSNQSVEATVTRLQDVIKEAGFMILAVVDHGGNAEKVGKELRPTQLILFGNPNVGTNFMAINQQIGIDLPQKMLVWEDADGTVYITYNDPQYLASRHAITGLDEVFAKVAGALGKFSSAGADSA